MTRTRKLVAVTLLVVVVAVSGLTAALATDNTKTYAYLPDHSVLFYDVSGKYAWAHREVDALALNKVIQGSGDHLFYPGNPITRADFIVMLDRTYQMSETVGSSTLAAQGNFTDVPAGQYYSQAIAAAKALGIATGLSDGSFHPQSNMTRQDAMVFLKRTLDRTQTTLLAGSVSAFSDANQITAYAREAVAALAGAQIVGGSGGKINPTSLVTRAEMAVMLYRATHMIRQDSGVFYEKRSDVVNVCIGAQVYRDVVIENYDPSRYYGELMRYSKLRQSGGVTYITLEENQPIDRTAQLDGNTLTLDDPDSDKEGATVRYPLAPQCVAIDVSTHYHQINAPVSTGAAYTYCYPSITDGEVTAIYYTVT